MSMGKSDGVALLYTVTIPIQADRLNSRITVCLLALSSVLLLSSHFMGDPITCWTPAQFTKQWSDFVNQYCYVHGTYFVPLNESLPFLDAQRRKVPINYYQWNFNGELASYSHRLVKPLHGDSGAERQNFGYDLAGAIQYVDGCWDFVKSNDTTFKERIAAFEGRASAYVWDGLRLARNKGSRDMALYYTISTVIQSLNAWMQSPLYTLWGPSLVHDLIRGDDWQVTGHFPRITHCDFNRRRPASVQARRVVSDYLATDPRAHTSRLSTEQFFRLLGKDGLFVLQQMSLNLGDIPASYLSIAMRNIGDRWIEEVRDIDDDLIADEKKLLKNYKPV
ncbi:hypothetical protein KIN20_001209 [Parelaphostrongylus tenuis]|uniref:Innexin n=1 Tax=Parelaphostrongylus tenuis TaxID=148309 RepID=A0AAD5MCJ1_PARTN|nr:hypothetical protein KIN20_001209 [Parelaphostrongylus tenuis]